DCLDRRTRRVRDGSLRPRPPRRLARAGPGTRLSLADLPNEWEATPEPGWVAEDLAEEFPGLGLLWTTLDRGSGRSPEALKEQLPGPRKPLAGGPGGQLR